MSRTLTSEGARSAELFMTMEPKLKTQPKAQSKLLTIVAG
jgi:hypothetical protein